ncbi:MAG: hypothetical protein BWX84_00766 [Verrucomicrobia bacterium ADurb.Bin118]|nr:MAG: hypothetical protein BWX84_00766 [Verrucomicrobia bacterium ADurb.Bin118]
MAVAGGDGQVFVHHVSRVNRPPISGFFDQVADGPIFPGLLLVFHGQPQVRRHKHHDVPFQEQGVVIGKTAQTVPNAFGGASAEVDQHRARQIREKFGGVKGEIHAAGIVNPRQRGQGAPRHGAFGAGVDVVNAIVEFAMHADSEGGKPRLVKGVFPEQLEAGVDMVQMNVVGPRVTRGRQRAIQRPRQIAQSQAIPAVTQFELFPRGFGDGEGLQILAVTEVDIGKPQTGPAQDLARARRVDDIGRERGKDAAVPFDLMQRQGVAFFRLCGWRFNRLRTGAETDGKKRRDRQGNPVLLRNATRGCLRDMSSIHDLVWVCLTARPAFPPARSGLVFSR